jgi:hypothetical protein
MSRALCLIREGLVYRRTIFEKGLRAAGYSLTNELSAPKAGDVVVMWNRYGPNEIIARNFERAGARVVVVENGYLGKTWNGDRWFALSLGQHAGAGKWNVGGDDRWDSLNIKFPAWRSAGGDVVILAQRGIGSPLVRSPESWAQKVQAQIGGRVRAHPGKKSPVLSLKEDLANASCVVTWASSAALSALTLGVPVWYDFPHWIGAQAARRLSQWGEAQARCSDEDRLAMFRRLIWAMWREPEIESGEAFRKLLQ